MFAMSQQSPSESGQSRSIEDIAALSLTKVLGVVPILPGEPADLYRRSLETLIEELGARSVLQFYLAEKSSLMRSTSPVMRPGI
jgi:hypothetical protein